LEDLMPYTNKALTVVEQVELLISKGLEADREHLARCLTNVSYHRLSGYWHPYRLYDENGEWTFRPKARFAAI
jgi:abortive infection bacteriophage resistance protein